MRLRLELFVLVVLVLPASVGAQEIPIGQPVTLAVSKGTNLVIHGVVGRIEVTKASGTDVVLTVTHAPGNRNKNSPDPRVEMVKDKDRITICSVHFSPNPKKQNECKPGGGRRLLEGIRKGSPGLRFQLEIPDGIKFWGKLWWGDIKANAGISDLDLRTAMGNISVIDNGSRSLWAHVEVQGDLEAFVSPRDWSYERHIRMGVSAFGHLRVTLPQTVPMDYTIFASHVMESPFPLAKPLGGMMRGRFGPDDASSTFLALDAGSNGFLYLFERADRR